MKRLLSILVIAVGAGSFGLAAQAKGPTIVFDSQSKDFGKVMQGETLKHVFKFTNKGSGMLEIFNVEGS
jgi:hypothetical protein